MSVSHLVDLIINSESKKTLFLSKQKELSSLQKINFVEGLLLIAHAKNVWTEGQQQLFTVDVEEHYESVKAMPHW